MSTNEPNTNICPKCGKPYHYVDEYGRLLVLQDPDMISKDDALKFALWIHNNDRVCKETHERYIYHPEIGNSRMFNLEALYEYWKTNIKEDKQ